MKQMGMAMGLHVLVLPLAVLGFAGSGDEGQDITCKKFEHDGEEKISCDGQLYKLDAEPEEAPEGCEETAVPGSSQFYAYFFAAVIAICFAGMMSGLTVGLMSFEEKNLSIMMLQSSDETERLQAKRVLKLIKNHHQLLVTLLLWNAAAFESLPIFIDKLVPSYIAILISVTFILIFGEIVPQAMCTGPRRLAIGANCYYPVRVLLFISYPLAVGFAKILDSVMGHRDGRDSQFMYIPRSNLGLEEDGRLALVELHGYTDRPTKKKIKTSSKKSTPSNKQVEHEYSSSDLGQKSTDEAESVQLVPAGDN